MKQERKTHIGGTDISVIMGVNPWRTQTQLLEEKKGVEPKFTPEQEERMYWGTVLEPVISSRYENIHGAELEKNVEIAEGIYIAHIDAIDTQNKKVIEVKTANFFAESDWMQNGVPLHYQYQVQWYMGMAKLKKAVVVTLFGGQTYKEFELNFDQALFLEMQERAAKWWQDHMIKGLPIVPQNEAECREVWTAPNKGSEIEVGRDVNMLVQELAAVKAQLKILEEAETQLKDQIIPKFEGAELMIHNRKTIARFTFRSGRNTTDWKEAASMAGATKDVIEKCTRSTPGGRVFSLEKAKKQ